MRSAQETSTRIMITSGGGPGVWGLLYALRRLPERTVELHANDPSADATLGTLLADERVRLPEAGRPEYVARLVEYCAAQRIDVLIPVYDGELLKVARERAAFERAGTRVLLPPEPVVALCVDKANTYADLRATSFVPHHAIAHTVDEAEAAIARLGYPRIRLCAKPVALAGGRGLHILDAACDRFAERMLGKPGPIRGTAEEFLETRRAGPAEFVLLISEYLEGEELGIDLLADDGRVVDLAVRRKGAGLLHGNPTHIEFREAPGERGWVERLAATLRLSGLLSIDARYDGTGELRLLEINARPGAYIGMTCARLHLLARAIDMLLGDRAVQPCDYIGDMTLNHAVRAFADVVVGPGGAQVLDIQPVAGASAPTITPETKRNAHARAVPGCAPR